MPDALLGVSQSVNDEDGRVLNKGDMRSLLPILEELPPTFTLIRLLLLLIYQWHDSHIRRLFLHRDGSLERQLGSLHKA